jgi:pyrroline-5-carboxylate reductase
VVVLAVKPQTFAAEPDGLRAWVGPQSTVISIMAGVPVAALRGLGAGAVARAMPNTPGAIGKGVTAVFGTDAGALAAAQTLLAPLGSVEVVASEGAIDIATAVSGSGPAYVFLLVEALAGAAVAQGLDEDVAMRLARRTVIGAGALLEADETDAAGLRRAVTSPGGTTQAALGELMAEDGLGFVMRRAVAAAVRRARELAGA